MELHLVGVQKASGVLPDVEAGIEVRLFFEKHKIQDADADAFLEYIVLLTWLNLLGVHLGSIEEGSSWSTEARKPMRAFSSIVISLKAKSILGFNETLP